MKDHNKVLEFCLEFVDKSSLGNDDEKVSYKNIIRNRYELFNNLEFEQFYKGVFSEYYPINGFKISEKELDSVKVFIFEAQKNDTSLALIFYSLIFELLILSKYLNDSSNDNLNSFVYQMY